MDNTLLSNIHWFLQNSLWLWQAGNKCLVQFFGFVSPGGNCFTAYQDHLSNESFFSWFSNLIFSLDTLELYRIDNDTKTRITLIKKGIAWWTDKNVKFRNPTGDGNNLTVLFQGKKTRYEILSITKHFKHILIPMSFTSLTTFY